MGNDWKKMSYERKLAIVTASAQKAAMASCTKAAGRWCGPHLARNGGATRQQDRKCNGMCNPVDKICKKTGTSGVRSHQCVKCKSGYRLTCGKCDDRLFP